MRVNHGMSLFASCYGGVLVRSRNLHETEARLRWVRTIACNRSLMSVRAEAASMQGPLRRDRSRFGRKRPQLLAGRVHDNMLSGMATPASSLKHCPDLLVPVMTNILASRPIVDRLSGDMQARRTQTQNPTRQCLHRQTVTLTRKEHDELMMLFNRTMGQAFIVPLRRSQFCTVSFATPPLLAKHLVHISLRKLASTRVKLGNE